MTFAVGDIVRVLGNGIRPDNRGLGMVMYLPGQCGIDRHNTARDPYIGVQLHDGARGPGPASTWVVLPELCTLITPAIPLTEAAKLRQILEPRPSTRYGPYKPIRRRLP